MCICPTGVVTVQPILILLGWWFSISSVLQSLLLCWQGVDPCMCSLGMSLGEHKQLLGSPFSELLPLCHIFQSFLVPSGLFQSSSQKARALVIPFCCTSANRAWVQPRDREGEKATRLALSPQDDSPTNQRGRFSSPQNFGFCRLLPPSWVFRAWYPMEWRKTKRDLYILSQILHSLSRELNWRASPGALFCLLVPISTSRWGCAESRLRDNRAVNELTHWFGCTGNHGLPSTLPAVFTWRVLK